MKKILLLLSATALWNCTDYAADWDEKYENSFSASNGGALICQEGESTIINQNNCATSFVCLGNTWIVDGTPQCQSETQKICVEGSTTAIVANNCAVNYICSGNAWIQYGEMQCLDVTPRVCEEGETTSLAENGCVTNYICSGNAWVLDGDVQCEAPQSSGTGSQYVMASTSTISGSNYGCSNAMFCGKRGDTYVKTGFGNGYWYYYGDYNDGGSSSFTWTYGGTASTFVEKSVMPYGDIKGKTSLGGGADAYLGLGFNVTGDSKKGANISSWKGLCVIYQSTAPFFLEVQDASGGSLTGYNDYKVALPTGKKANTAYLANVLWSDFSQEEGWGKVASKDEVLESTSSISFKFTNATSSTNIFAIIAVGKYGTCK